MFVYFSPDSGEITFSLEGSYFRFTFVQKCLYDGFVLFLQTPSVSLHKTLTDGLGSRGLL